jgi:hypothetical protein
MWATWAFLIKHFCGSLLPAVKSCHFPHASLDLHVTEGAQLFQIKLAHNLCKVLDLQQQKHAIQG